MKTFMSAITILTALGSTASATAIGNPNALQTTHFTSEGNSYVGENHGYSGKRSLDIFMQKRCDCGTACYGPGNACIIGNCECGGQEGCYSCNGGPPVCQTTGADGVPNSCYQ